MRGSLVALAACFLVAPLSGCIGSFETVQALGWKPGYAFTFETTESGSEETHSYENGTETASHQDAATDDKETLRYQVLSVDDRIGDDTYAIVVTQPLTGSARLRAYSQSDLSSSSASVDGTAVDVRGNHRDEAPLRFPLTADQSYEDAADSADEGIVARVEVEGSERVDGPDGRVDAVRIHHTYEADAEALRINIEKSIVDDGGRDIDVDAEVKGERTVWYAPSLHNIVRDELSASISYDVAYTNSDGTRQRNTIEASVESTTVLTAATFAVGDDLDASGILRALKLGAHPGAVVPEPGVGTTLRLTGTGGEVGLTHGTDLTLSVATQELASPVAVELSGPSGTQRGQVPASGGDLRFTVSQPGVYTWTASTTGEDERATTVLRVAVGLRETIQADCPPATAQGSCGEVQFPLPEGIARLEVSAERTPLLLEPGVGTLYVDGPAGEESDTMTASNTATVTIVAPPPGSYSARLDLTGLGNSVAYTVVADAAVPDAPGARVRTMMGW